MIFQDFQLYPTPHDVLNEYILQHIPSIEGKHFLEPSAGTGSIMQWLLSYGAKSIVYAEKEARLSRVASKYGNCIGNDTMKLTSDQISHVDFIVMNPPFRNQWDHISHLWQIMPIGSQLISIVNFEATYSSTYKELKPLIAENGYFEKIGQVFKYAERKTNVTCGVVVLRKSGSSEKWDFFGEKEGFNTEGITRYSEILALVSEFKTRIDTYKAWKEMNDNFIQTNPQFFDNSNHQHSNFNTGDLSLYKIQLLKTYWKKALQIINISSRYLNQSIKDEMAAKLTRYENVPFTVANIWRLGEIIVGTHGQRTNKMLLECFDKVALTARTNEKNIVGVQYAHNLTFMFNRKMIIPNVHGFSWGGKLEVSWGKETDIDNLNRCLSEIMNIPDLYYEKEFVTVGKWLSNQYGKVDTLKKKLDKVFWDFVFGLPEIQARKGEYGWYGEVKKNWERILTPDSLKFAKELKQAHEIKLSEARLKIPSTGTWLTFGVLDLKFCKNRNVHVKFNNLDAWAKLNQKLFELKGWDAALPETTTNKLYKTKKKLVPHLLKNISVADTTWKGGYLQDKIKHVFSGVGQLDLRGSKVSPVYVRGLDVDLVIEKIKNHNSTTGVLFVVSEKVMNDLERKGFIKWRREGEINTFKVEKVN